MFDQKPEFIHLIARLTPRRGRETDLANAVLAIVPAVRQERGCIAYQAHVSDKSPGMIVMYEIWADQQAHDEHAAGPHLTELAARFDELLAMPLEIEVLTRIG